MNVLQLVQQATAEMGLPVPNYVTGNAATDTVQQLALLNALGMELRTEHPWEAINKEYRFTTVYQAQTATLTTGSATVSVSAPGVDATYMVIGTGVPQDTFVVSSTASTVTLSNPVTASGSYTLTFCKVKYNTPSDFDRYIDRTMWDKTRRWELLGPSTPEQWSWLKSGYISTGPRIRFRIRGGKFEMWPPLAANELIGFEYVSNAWASGVDGTAKSLFSADDDTCIYPDRLMIAGLKKKYFEVKGFDTTIFAADFVREYEKAKGQDSASPTLSFAPDVNDVLIGIANLPDSGYGT